MNKVRYPKSASRNRFRNDSKQYDGIEWARSMDVRRVIKNAARVPAPTVFVGKLVRANAKGMNAVETAQVGMKRVR